MATWSGWVIEFLNRAGLMNTPPNQTFMSEWASHSPGRCKNNPVTLSKSVSGSTRCGATVAGFGRTQNYPTHAAAAHAFQLSIATDWVKPLKDALNSGNPFQIGDRTAVVAVLQRWGSPTFATWYQNATTDGTTGSSGNPSTKAPHTHSGYHDLQHVMEKRLPAALRDSGKLTTAALRHLGRAHKVKG